ncbi:hypothetical protein F4780DRAFT_282098 [Xylariomycetidae sp. FL0641]|nr:hypothetical protein F4780DRAFT_282098 [Xylariomycetidae sp. FL0641]
MQRVTSLLPSWDRNRSSTGSNNTIASNATNTTNGNNPNTNSLSHARKNSTDRVRGWADKLPSVNRFSTSSRLGREAFWPATLDKECEKAARILKSFCTEGFAIPDERPGTPLTQSSASSIRSSATSTKTLKKIPPRVIQNAVGLAVFTSMRSGLWTSGSGGSGILIARRTDGTWSPPSGLMLQTASLGFVLGVDIYDCVLVINNFTVLETFARPKLTLGSDVTLTGGPLATLGLLENDVTWAADLSDTAITYVKAKGQCSEVKLDGTVLNERADENERFYGMQLSVAKILAGDINQSLPQTRSLTEVLKAAEGRVDYDAALVDSLSAQPAPGDATIETPSTVTSPSLFGIPDAADPDPFGVMALEMAGIGIKEAGTHLRPESTQFEFHPSPTSPAFSKFARQSVDTFLSRSNRGSYMSSKTMATERSLTTDAGTQTFAGTPETTPSHSQSQSEDGNHQPSMDDVPELKEPDEIDYTKIDISALRKLSNFPDLDEPVPATTPAKEESADAPDEDAREQETAPAHHTQAKTADKEEEQGSLETPGDEEENSEDGDEDDDIEEEDDEEEELDDDDDDLEGDDDEAVVFEVATAQAPRVAMAASQIMHAKGAVVNIPRRVAPPVPVRSPARTSRRKSQMPDISTMISSPLRQEFDTAPEAHGSATPKASQPSQDADDYFTKKHETSSSTEKNTMTEVSPPADEQVELKSAQGVTVTVA